MGDLGIVIISLTGRVGDVKEWIHALELKPHARVLEVHVEDETRAEDLATVSRLAEERGMQLRLRAREY
jgi:hypothetical protein